MNPIKGSSSNDAAWIMVFVNRVKMGPRADACSSLGVALASLLLMSCEPRKTTAQKPVLEPNVVLRDESRSRLYQQWLIDGGLAAHLLVRSVSAPPSLSEYRLTLRLTGGSSWEEDQRLYRTISQLWAETYGTPLEERLLIKFAHLMEVPMWRARVFVDAGCPVAWIQADRSGRISNEAPKGPCEAMQGGPSSIPKPVVDKFIDTLAKSQHKSVPRGRILTDGIRGFLEKRFTARGTVKFHSSTEANYLEFTVRDMRGEVTGRDRYWEKVQLSLFWVASDTEYKLRVLMDGQYAAGINPPGDSGYRDLEPTYSQALNAYAMQELDALANEISNAGATSP